MSTRGKSFLANLPSRMRSALDVLQGRSFPMSQQKLMIAAQRAVRAARHFERERGNGYFNDGYDAARTGRMRSDWGTTTDVPYYQLNLNHVKIRARSRELFKNDPTYRQAVKVLVNLVIGTGLRPKPAVTDYNGKLNQVINAELTRHISRYLTTKDWDAGGRHSFIGKGQRLAFQTQVVSGDVILNAVRAKPGRYLPIAWQMVEVDRLDDSKDLFTRTFEFSENVKQVAHGINLDENGAPVSYWFKGVEKPVSALNVIHSFFQERPEQYIGEPPSVATLDSIYDKHDLDEDYTLKSRAIAKVLWTLSNLDNSFPNASEQDSDGYIPLDAMSVYRGDDKPEPLKMPDSVSETIEPLLKMKKHDISSALGLSYISVMLDMAGVNFAAASMNNLKEYVNTSCFRSEFVDSLCQPFYEKFVRMLVVQGKLSSVDIARFEADPYHYTRCTWASDRREHADPLKTSTAAINDIKAGRKTLAEDLAERGKDLSEHIRELSEEQEALRQGNVKLDWLVEDVVDLENIDPVEADPVEQTEE